MPTTDFLKSWVKWFVIFLLGATVVVLPPLLQHEASRMELIQTQHNVSLSTSATLIENMLAERRADTNVLAESLVVIDVLNGRNNENYRTASQLFESFCDSYQAFDQIRLLDIYGNEVIRINYNGIDCSLVPEVYLKDTYDRDYYQETLKLSKGQIYTSPLVLNVEHNRIETPHKPIIRFASPVYNDAGSLRGVIVLNYLAKNIQEALSSKNQIRYSDSEQSSDYLVNQDGYYLNNVDNPSKTFGFILENQNDTFTNDYPEVWQAAQGGKDSIKTADGLFLITRVPVPVTSTLNVTPVSTAVPARYWYIFHKITNATLYDSSILYHPYRFITYSLYLIVIGLIALLWTKRNQEMSARLAAEKQQRALNEELSLILSSAAEGIYGIDIEGKVTFSNQAASRLLGWTAEDLIGNPLHQKIHYKHSDGSPYPESKCPINYSLKDGKEHRVDDDIFWRKDGEPISVSYVCNAMTQDDQITGAVILFQDITERLQKENQLQDALLELNKASTTDKLTGLRNRLKLDKDLKYEIKRAERSNIELSLIIIDVDYFKNINDEYGHLVGDRVLKDIAAIFANHIRRIDTLGRWGGEEFLVLCPYTDLIGATRLAEKLRNMVETYPFPFIGHKTCSFGVTSRLEKESPTQMISRADRALYLAKDNGRNCVVSLER